MLTTYIIRSDYFSVTDKFKFKKYNSLYGLGTNKIDGHKTTRIITGAQPKAGTGHKMQTVSVVFSTLHCEGYTADLRYIAGSLLFWSLK